MTTPADPRDDQARIPQQPTAEPTGVLSAEAATPRRRRWPWIAGGFAAVLLAVAGITWAVMPSTEDKAIERCQEEIRSRLKSPSTAVFVEPVRMDNSAEVFRIYGEVDAQNGFGATVRGDYRCFMRLTDDGEWTGIETDFDQR